MSETSQDARAERGQPRRWLLWGIVGASVLVAATLVFGRQAFVSSSTSETKPVERPIRLESSDAEIVEVAPATAARMKLSVAEVSPSQMGTELNFSGQLYLEGSRRSHVHTRFGGEVVEVGECQATEGQPGHQVRVGDHVKKGQLLAVIWSKEIGEKKSDLVDAISQLVLHEAILRKLNQTGGAIAQRNIEEMQRNYEADLIQVSRLRRTLRSWRVSDDELQQIEREARRIHEMRPAPDTAIKPSESEVELEKSWAEIEIHSPVDAIVLEKNFTVGDIVDTTLDLFILGDLSRVGVMANVYEEDLPKLAALPPDKRHWSVRMQANPDFPPYLGQFDRIGNVIDPNQHTAVVTGWLENPQGQLRIGQFVRATVELPPEAGLVEAPVSAVLDEGPRSYVFVALNAEGTRFQKRQIALARRSAKNVWIHAEVPANHCPKGAQPLQAGERVVVSGAVELAGALKTLRTETP